MTLKDAENSWELEVTSNFLTLGLGVGLRHRWSSWLLMAVFFLVTVFLLFSIFSQQQKLACQEKKNGSFFFISENCRKKHETYHFSIL